MIKEFICENCGRNLMQGDDFSYAAFLYGVFFLEGPNDGFVGTTCPSCLKTAYKFTDKAQFEEISDDIRFIFRFAGKEIFSCFNYFSPAATFRMYGDLHKQDSSILSDEYVNVISSPDDIPLDGPEFRDANVVNLYSSYGRSSQPVMGSFFHNIWVNHEQALRLIEMENADNLRMIPRYIFRNDLLEKTENLFCTYYDHNDVRCQLIKELDETCIQIEELVKHDKELQFHEILTTTPIPSHYPGSKNVLDFLLTIRHPFFGLDINQTISNALSDDTDISEYLSYIETVELNYNKNYSLRFLEDNIDSFFQDYTQDFLYNITRANWCHADLWRLIYRYLFMYQRQVRIGLIEEEKYFFYKTGKGFGIKFNGKVPIHGFDKIGFYYFYYLLKNENQKVSSQEMYQKCRRLKGMYSDDSITIDLVSNATIGDYFYFADQSTKDYFEKRKQELLQLQQNSDEATADAIAKEIEDMSNSITKEYFTKRGKRKKKRTTTLDNTTNAVGNAIDEAIEELRNCGGEQIAAHFEKCIDKPRGDYLKYQSNDPEIKWTL